MFALALQMPPGSCGVRVLPEISSNSSSSAEIQQPGGATQMPPVSWASGGRRVLRILALSLYVALVAVGSLALYAGVPANEGIWLANGVLLAILLTNPRRDWLWLLALNFILNVGVHSLFFGPSGTRYSLGVSLSYSLLNIVEVSLAAALISRKIEGHPDIAHLPTLGWIALYGPVVACAMSSMLASFMALLMDPFSRNHFQIRWYFSEALGMAIMTPLALAIRLEDLRSIVARKKVLETIVLLALVSATALFVFWQNEYPIMFLLFPVLLLVMFRLGTSGSAAAVFLVSIPAIYCTLHGRGPFTMVRGGTFVAKDAVLYGFIVVLVSMVYAVAAALAGRRRLEIELRQSEGNFRVLAEYSQDMIVRTGLDGRARYFSPSVLELTGWTPAELTGNPVKELVHPEHQIVFEQMWQSLAVNSAQQVATYPLKLKTGSYLWVESNARLVSDPATGQAREVVSVIRDVSRRVADQQQLIQAYREAEVLVTTDPLTGLTNRRGFDETLRNEWRHALSAHSRISLLMVDVDYFKAYNDLYGHPAGDDCLKAIARTLKRGLYRPADLPARLGGDEFAILLPNTPVEGAREIAERLRAAVAALELEPEPDVVVQTSVSIGCACLSPTLEDDPRLLLSDADKALYAVKRARSAGI
jgi:diguanylate cyclase (GGDEF)-like protein/PAS domain S-box-containing protein